MPNPVMVCATRNMAIFTDPVWRAPPGIDMAGVTYIVVFLP